MISTLKALLIVFFVIALIYGLLFPGMNIDDLGGIAFVLLLAFLWGKWAWQMFTFCFFIAGIYMFSQGGGGIIFGIICLAVGIFFLLVLLGKEPQLFKVSHSKITAPSFRYGHDGNHQDINEDITKSVFTDNKHKNLQSSNVEASESLTPEQLKNLRVSLSRTQEGMAKILQVSRHTWVKWETGVERPNHTYLAQIKKLMDFAEAIEPQGK